MNSQNIGIILCIIVIILIYFYYDITNRKTEYEDYLNGFWEAPKDFLESAEASSIYLYIGKIKNGERKVTMTVDYGNTLAEIQTWKIKSPWYAKMKYNATANISIENNESSEVLPKTADIECDMQTGSLIITGLEDGNAKLYGLFHKQHEITLEQDD